MRLFTNIRCALILSTASWLTLQLVCLYGASSVAILDLTLPSPRGASPGRIPGGSFGGVTDLWQSPPPLLPFEISIQRSFPTAVTPRELVTVEILLKNTGQQPIAIPASRDFGRVMADGNRDRRILSVAVRLRPTVVGRKDVLETIGAAAGSATHPESMIVLLSQESILIRARERLSETSSWKSARANSDLLAVRALVKITTLEDERYFVKSTAEGPVSVNAIDVVWHRE